MMDKITRGSQVAGWSSQAAGLQAAGSSAASASSREERNVRKENHLKSSWSIAPAPPPAVAGGYPAAPSASSEPLVTPRTRQRNATSENWMTYSRPIDPQPTTVRPSRNPLKFEHNTPPAWIEPTASLDSFKFRITYVGDPQTLRGSFSAVSSPIFAGKYSLVTRCYAKQYEIFLRCMSPCSVCTADFFQLKMLRIASQ